MTKSRIRKNPKYQLGDIIRRNLRRENLRRSYDFSIPYEQALPGADSDYYYPSNAGISNSEFSPNIDDEGNIIPSEDSTPGIFSGIGHFLFGDYEHAADRWREASIADSWRLFHEKRLQAETTNRLNQVNEAKLNLSELDAAEQYADLIDKRNSLQEQYKAAVSIGSPSMIQKISEDIYKVEQDITNFLDNIKTKGKSSDINALLFFDPNKASYKDVTNRFKESFLGDSDPNSSWIDPRDGVEYGLSMLQNIATTAQMGIGLLTGENLPGDITRRAIKKSLPTDRWTDNLFEGYDTNLSTNQLRNRIQPLRDYWNGELERRSALERESANKYKNGAWYFDPQKINPKFRRLSENNDSGLIGGLLPDQLAYSLAEMGSSYSDFENMAGMMLTDLSAGAAAKAIGFFARKTNPYINALSTLKLYSELKAANRLNEAAKLERRVSEAQKIISAYGKGISATEQALGIGTQAANLYFINRMREHETNSEVIDAWSNRVLQNSMNRGADLNKVLDVSKQYLNQVGISTDNMTDIDIIQHALAYDIPTGDSVFEKEKEEGIQGLRKVHNDNMALAAKDYFEAIPFLNYSSSFLRSFGRRQANKLADLTYNAVAKSAIDRAIEKIGAKGLDKIGRKLAQKHTLEFLAKRLKQAGYVATLEGIEEGQQELLQSRYSRGEYDDYSKTTSTFPLASIIDDTNLASDAVAAYMGVLYGDPDNDSPQIRRAMLIGATTGLLMGGASFGALSNLVPSTGRDNFRNLVGQIKNDRVIGRLVGEAYGNAQDDAHLDLFYEAFDKHGINNERLRKSLQDLKLFKGEAVSDEYIDRDIDLVDNLWYAYNSPTLKKFLDDSGKKKGTEEYKRAVKMVARHITLEKDAAKYVERDLNEQEQQKNSMWREILDDIRNDYTEDDAVNVRTDNVIRELRADYQQYLKEHKSRRSKWADEIDRISKKAVPQEWELKKLEELRQKDAEYMAEQPKDFVTFAEDRLSSLYTYRYLLNAERQVDLLTKRKLLLEEISKELGIDITPSRVQHLIDSILNKREELYQLLENEDVKLANEMREALNKRLTKQNKLNKKFGKKRQNRLKLVENIAARLEKRYGMLPNQEEIDHLQQRSLLNMAVYDSAKAITRAFVNGKIDPREAYKAAHPLQWKSLSDEEKQAYTDALNKERAENGKNPLTVRGAALQFIKEQKQKVYALERGAKDYEDYLHKHSDMDDDAFDNNPDAELMQRDAARNLLEFELDQHQDLNRINHREHIRTESTIQIERRAKDGDEDAKEVIREKIKETPEEKEPNTSADTEPGTHVAGSSEIDPTSTNSVEGMEIGYGAEGSFSADVESTPQDQGSVELDPSTIDTSTSVEMDPAEFELYDLSTKEKNLRKRFGMDNDRPDSVEIEDEEENQSVELEDEPTIDDTKALYQLQETGETDYDSYLHTRSERTIQKPDEIYADFLGLTFKYFPNEKNNDGTEVKPPTLQNVFVRNGKVIKEPIVLRNNALLGTGYELSKKLLIPGWFEKAEKYFIITQDERDSKNINDPDNFVVAMIIQDGDVAYATFMEGLKYKTSHGKVSGGYEYLRTKMQQMFYSYFDYNGKRYYLRNEDGSINEQNHELGTNIIRRNEYLYQNPSVDVSKVTTREVNDWYLNKATKEQKDQVDYRVRKFLSGNRAVHTNDHIEELIRNLKATRDAIIDAALNKDSGGNYIFKSNASEMNEVSPLNPRISDGAINELKDDEGYTFRKLTDGGFGMSTDLEELTQQIQNEEVRIGVGRGERAYGDAKGRIDKLDPSENASYDDAGYGYAGKLYFIAKTVSGKDRGIILAEKKFRPSADKIQPEDIEESFDNTGKLIDGRVPSIAEFILRLVTDMIDDSVFEGISATRIQSLKNSLINILVNADPSTWVTRKDESGLQHFAQKQFFVDEKGRLVIALPDKNGVYHHIDYKLQRIRQDANIRKTIIAAIANNLHWNTDRVLMTSGIETGIMEALYEVFSQNPELEEYSFAGLEDLTFKKSDLFTKDLEYKDVSLAAWLFATGKILTTVGDTLFRAPFVYADGPISVKPAQAAANQLSETVKSRKKKQVTQKPSDEVSDRKQNLLSRLKELDNSSVDKISNLTIISGLQQRRTAEEDSGYVMHDYAILDIETGSIYDQKPDNEIQDSINKSIERYKEFLKKNGINGEINVQIDVDPSQYSSVTQGSAMIVAFRMDDGIHVTVDTLYDIESMNEDGFPIAGVYSTEEQKGQLDVEKARAWVKQTLGLLDSQVIITNGILRGLNNKPVYGVTEVSTNILSELIQGTFIFSKYAGSGIHYHEAFHYVNLLLHTKQQRDNIYKEYIKIHPEYKTLPKRQLEELLAEEFREYCEFLDDEEARLANYSGIRKWIARLMNRIVEFVKAFTKKDIISKMYKDIRSGAYARLPLDQQSVEEFNKAYNGKVYSDFSVSGKTSEELDKLKTISSYQEFYNTAESVAHYFLDFANIKHINNVRNLNGNMFKSFFEKLRLNNARKPNLYIQDVIDNPALFIDTINGLLKSYGIVPKNKRGTGTKQIQDDADSTLGKNPNENEIANLAALYDNYKIDQKTNVAFRAKLFLSQVKDVRFEFDESTGENKLVQNTDPITGLPLYYSYSDAWHTISSELNKVDSFEELLKTVQRLAKTKKFFAQLYKNLLSIGQDTELQTLIYNTVNKHLVTVAHLQLDAERKRRKSPVDLELSQSEVAPSITKKYDEERNIEIINDNGLKAKKMLPKDWSKDLFASALITFDNYHHINKAYVDRVLKPRLNELLDKILNVKNASTKEKQELVEWAFPRVIDLLQKMSIPFDEDVLMEYLTMHIKPKTRDLRKKEQLSQVVSYDDLFDAMLEILQKPGGSKYTNANISFFINEVFTHALTTDVRISKKKSKGLKIANRTAKKLDELYVGFPESEIEKMAVAYNTVHPSSRELSVTGPDNKLIYPVGENNFMSDVTRWINKNHNQFIQKMLSTPYANNSYMLDIARIIVRSGNTGNYEFKLNVFTGIQDDKSKKGVDYFGVNSIEDVISKMLLAHNNMLILPTMADKKTYYAIELVSRRGDDDIQMLLPHDLLILNENKDFTDDVRIRRFSKQTLERFAKYFIDELESVDLYYKRENVKAVVENKNVRRKNFHGKVKDGRMDFSGNGGKFRYFYGLEYAGLDDLNLNQLLEYEYLRQQNEEDPNVGEGVSSFREGDQELDGFEAVRARLKEIRNYFFDANGKAKPELFDAINDMLFKRIDENMQSFSNEGSSLIIQHKSYKDPLNPQAETREFYMNRAIPKQLISEYADKYNAKLTTYDFGAENDVNKLKLLDTMRMKQEDILLSIIGNYTAQSMISIIEVEKVFSGDPAFYKWNYSKKKEPREINGLVYELSILTDKDTDKIKRLGALLSPGSELRTDFSEREYQMFPWLRGTKYTNATIADIKAKSIYADEIKGIFERQILADKLRKTGADTSVIDGIYYDENVFKKQMSLLSKQEQETIKGAAELQADPYTDITVSDAQVIVRPDMYRKIRMMLGQWSVIPTKITYKNYSGQILTTTYSDNEAFEILENDPKWMSDPEKAAKVSRLQLFPLKMTYFKNDPRNICPDYDIAYGVYNKMAIFPAFKYLMRSTTGRLIYDRMNTKGNELDMITFESAVKVGLGANIYSPYKKDTDDLSQLNPGLSDAKSSVSLDGNTENWITDPNSLTVEVLDIRGLRMQLNTEAHTDEERAIGTQMFKIMFSNLYDNEDYVQNKSGRTPRKGKEIRNDIMKCIKALTAIGVHDIKKKFYDDNMDAIDKDKVVKYLRQVAENNGLSESVLDILNNGATIESLMQRTLFEHSISSLVNSNVIDINTKGGSAVQQSVFGFVSYGANVVRSEENLDESVLKDDEDGFHVLNDGRELSWNEEDGSMEVMLSMNFFKAVVPKQYQTSYKSMRNWLISHDVIKGYWKDADGVIHQSHPKPFGVGYRIPTQGLSSTFAFTVADVLPEQSGDLIIVPREFTAQTGSDFDIDKLFLSTLSYKEGLLETYDGDDLTSASKGAIGNRLLLNYIDVVTDIKNRANARASIDTITDIIQNSTLPAIRGKNETYRDAMYELTPYFQLRRKQEFSIGKSGIGPFALNITNLALTQYAHLTLDFSELPFTMGNLDEVIGEDGNRISDWLSAMVNAHVDVAKDPYVFDLNINGLTYNYTNLLLRAGKGESTFLFLAQPALKEYASEYNNAGGLYGNNLRNAEKTTSRSKMLDKYVNNYRATLNSMIANITNEEQKKYWQDTVKNIGKDDFDWNIVFNKEYLKIALNEGKTSIRGVYFQLLSLMTMKMLEPYAQELSDLVKMSRIDTKKFGNTLAQQREFLSEYSKFKDNEGRSDIRWKITNKDVSRPLDYYFSETFLDTKLYAATGLMKEILSTQSFMATPVFSDICNTVLGDIFGFVEYTDANGNKLHTHDKIYGATVANEISIAIENVMRHRMLEQYGTPRMLPDDEYSWSKVERDNSYSGPIDFTFGGYSDERNKELKRIMFGDKQSKDPYEQNSIFRNISILIQRLENSSMEERSGVFRGLVNQNGRVINELLNYLRPQPENDKYPIPTLLLKKTNRNTESSEKNRLISAFDFLLRNSTPNIRRLGRDLAIYAYYSTYNTNKHNTFFDVVPMYYREQYDQALAKGVEEQNSIGSVFMLDAAGNKVSIAEQTAKEMIDMIGTNFYDNDDIVPLYEIDKNNRKILMEGKGGIFIGFQIKVPDVKHLVPSNFVTTNVNKPYVKMQVDDEIFLYRKLGYFTKIDGDKETGMKWHSYVLTAKKGIHEGSIQQYELASNPSEESIFEQNKMPDTFNMNLVRFDQGQFMQRSKDVELQRWEKSNKKKDPIGVKFVLYNPTIEKGIEKSVHDTLDENMKNDNIVYANDVQSYINDNSDVTIDLSAEDYESQINQLELNIQYSAEKDGIAVGIVNIPSGFTEDGMTDVLMRIQSANPNVSDLYIEGSEVGNKIKDLYNKSDYSFADNIIMVYKKQDTTVEEKKEPSETKEVLKQMDESLKDIPKTSTKVEIEGSYTKTNMTMEQIKAELARRKAAMLQQSPALQESLKKSVPKFYSGRITPADNVIFVFGSNPEGRHGAGSAKTAREKFGAIRGQGEGLQGNSYAIPTKDLRVKENRGLRSISPELIILNIKRMYEVAKQNPSKRFMVAYTNLSTEVTLNGYTGAEMVDMFKKAGEIPENVEFSENWKFAWNDDIFNTKC